MNEMMRRNQHPDEPNEHLEPYLFRWYKHGQSDTRFAEAELIDSQTRAAYMLA